MAFECLQARGGAVRLEDSCRRGLGHSVDVAVKEFELSYSDEESLFLTICT